MRRPEVRPSVEMPPERLWRFSRADWGVGDLVDQVERWQAARGRWLREHGDVWPLEAALLSGLVLYAHVAGRMRRWAGVGDAPDEWSMIKNDERGDR